MRSRNARTRSRSPSGMTSVPIPSPGMTAIRYGDVMACFAFWLTTSTKSDAAVLESFPELDGIHADCLVSKAAISIGLPLLVERN
jgi:hypothetical protein